MQIYFRDGEEWSNRRRTLNKVFLMPQVISEYTPIFNEVISDMLAKWDSKLGPDASNSGLLINDLEKELYNWSIECKCALAGSSAFQLAITIGRLSSGFGRFT